MFYRSIIIVLILSSFGIGFFPYQASILRILGIIYLISLKGISYKNIKAIALTSSLAVLHYLVFRQNSIIPFYLTVVFVILLRKVIIEDVFRAHFIQVATVLSILTIFSALLGLSALSVTTLNVDTSVYRRIGFFLYTHLPAHVLGYEYYRPVLCFYEPGSYQIIFALALFWNLYFQGLGSAKSILLLFGLLANFSTAGLISLALLFAFHYYRARSLSSIFLGLVLALPIYNLVSENIKDKFLGDNSESSIARIVDFNNGLYIIKKRPILGHGILEPKEYSRINTKKFYQKYFAGDDYTQNTLYGRGNSVGVLNVVISFGLLGLLLLGYLFFRYSERNFFWKLIIGIYSISQPLILTPLVLLIITAGHTKLSRLHSLKR